ncbi:MAG TPA: protein phosphatase 2C domain-containing protein [Verrucomicrobiae bacterium]|nr:protein phosphatase 2C domain-containing protein [Verrucomicrobiae bacterium]
MTAEALPSQPHVVETELPGPDNQRPVMDFSAESPLPENDSANVALTNAGMRGGRVVVDVGVGVRDQFWVVDRRGGVSVDPAHVDVGDIEFGSLDPNTGHDFSTPFALAHAAPDGRIRVFPMAADGAPISVGRADPEGALPPPDIAIENDPIASRTPVHIGVDPSAGLVRVAHNARPGIVVRHVETNQLAAGVEETAPSGNSGDPEASPDQHEQRERLHLAVAVAEDNSEHGDDNHYIGVGGHLAVVADGVSRQDGNGPESDGRFASGILVQTLGERFDNRNPEDYADTPLDEIVQELVDTLNEASRRMASDPDHHNSGTTVTALFVVPYELTDERGTGYRAILAGNGDSPGYRLSGLGDFEQITKSDNTNKAYEINRWLGAKNPHKQAPSPDSYWTVENVRIVPIEIGDLLALFTDGCTDGVSESTILGWLTTGNLQEAIDSAVANSPKKDDKTGIGVEVRSAS